MRSLKKIKYILMVWQILNILCYNQCLELKVLRIIIISTHINIYKLLNKVKNLNLKKIT